MGRPSAFTVSLIAIDLAYQIASAMETVHSQGIAHRDLKPHNILMVRKPPLNRSSATLNKPLLNRSSITLNKPLPNRSSTTLNRKATPGDWSSLSSDPNIERFSI